MKKCILLYLLVLTGASYAEAQKLRPLKKPESQFQITIDTASTDRLLTIMEKPSDESIAYGLYRLELTKPPYGLAKVKRLAKYVEAIDNKLANKRNLTATQINYLQLTIRERFTYNMLYPEEYRQICSAMPTISDEQKKLFAQLPAAFGEYGWNEPQSKFFISHRDSVILYLKDCITKGSQIGVNFKHVIVNINAKEMIPLIVNTYNREKKDHDLLTVLMLLLKNNAYKPFLASGLYKTLYADENASYESYIDFTPENEALIIRLANEFYRSSST